MDNSVQESATNSTLAGGPNSPAGDSGHTSAERQIKEPPEGFFHSLLYMGPGLILSAAIVGSGELVLTTTMGAKAGFALLWVILIGCVAKVAVQLEYGRYCIRSGLTTFQGWNRVGTLKWFGIHWSVYCGVLYLIATFFGQAGVLGGSAQVLNYFVPALPTTLWALLLALSLALLVFHGRYAPVEWIATALNFIFVATIIYCVYALQSTPYAFSGSDIAYGLSFHFPVNTLSLAVAAFGITGVASGEIAMYPYWCIEKGYARWTGPREDNPAWVRRAKGWMRVMTMDAVISMLVYTVSTGCFYILGAAALQAEKDNLRDGNAFIFQLSSMFTNILGDNARLIFMICAFVVLFSTVFANTAGFSRVWTDFFGLCRWIDWSDIRQRRRTISLMAWVFPLTCGIIYFSVQQMFLLVVFMGIANSIFLLVVAYQAVVFRYWNTEPALRPSPIYDMALWISLLSIAFMAGYTIYTQVIAKL